MGADTVVIGAGVVGLSAALELARAGRRVVVLERGAPAQSASWAGGGILSPLPPDHCPPELRGLVDESLALYESWCQTLHWASGIDPEYWVCGASLIRAGKRDEYPGIAQVRNPRLLKALLLAAERQGVIVKPHSAVQGLTFKGDRIESVQTQGASMACASVVVCAGAWSSDLAPLPIRPIKGQMLLLRSEAGWLNRIIMDEEVYVVPRRDGHLLVGSTLEDVGFDLQTTPVARDGLLKRACALVPGLGQWPMIGHWAGLRPRPAGDAPKITADAIKKGLFYNAGHYRLGITLAPASARRLVALLQKDGL